MLDWPPSPTSGRLEAVRCRERLEVPTILSRDSCSLSISFVSVNFAPPTCTCQKDVPSGLVMDLDHELQGSRDGCRDNQRLYIHTVVM